MPERRFNEAEVAAIFERATESQQVVHAPLWAGEGMTLAELEDIGSEAGIAPELVRHAATVIERGGPTTVRRFLGLPVGVGRNVHLNRSLSDHEWERLVVDLRQTFDARGVVGQDGSLRQWTNGNLQVFLEPTATGHRVRLRTVRREALSLMGGGLATVAIAATAALSAVLRGADPASVASLGLLAAGGAAVFAACAFPLHGWARLRERQMQDVAERLTGAEPHHVGGGRGEKL